MFKLADEQIISVGKILIPARLDSLKSFVVRRKQFSSSWIGSAVAFTFLFTFGRDLAHGEMIEESTESTSAEVAPDGIRFETGEAADRNTQEIHGVLDAVTVYRGQAMVTRRVDVPGPAGLREVIVGQLPDRILAGSLFAEIVDGGEVRSVRYRVRPLSRDVREDVRQIDERIRDAKDRLQTVEKRKQFLSEQKAYLDLVQQFTAATAHGDLARGVLNAETLQSLSLFLAERRETLSSEELQLAFEERDLLEQTTVMQREREVLTGRSALTAREAVVFLNVIDADGATLQLRYLVDGANWTPSFNLRADSKRENVVVEYLASIQQMSGEDWDNVAMTLSTATPSLASKAPTLSPLFLTLSSSDMQRPPIPEVELRMRELRTQKKQMEQQRNMMQQAQSESSGEGKRQITGIPSTVDFDRRMNELSSQEQVLDILNRVKPARNETASSESREGLSVTYQLVDRSSLPSRSDRQLVQIARLPLKGEFYRIAMPTLSEYVYEEASLKNTSDIVLLAGPSATYVEGEFVGHGEVPTVTTGERFTVGLGIDSTLRTGRDLLHRNESVQGGNRTVELSYRLWIENYADVAKSIGLMDRLPNSPGHDIKITLVDFPDLSNDPEYLKTDRKRGLLRWDVEAESGRIGSEAKFIDFKYTLEFDKGMTVSGMLADAGRRD